jgi:hypothetical protein
VCLKNGVDVLTPDINNLVLVEEWLDQRFSQLYPLVDLFQGEANSQFCYQLGQGFEIDGESVKNIADHFSVPATASENILSDPAYGFGALLAMSTTLAELSHDTELVRTIKLWRNAFIHRWLHDRAAIGDLTLQHHLVINRDHWVVALLQHLKLRRDYLALQQCRVGWYYTSTYADIVCDNKIFGRDLDEVRRYIDQRPQNRLLAWWHDFQVWLWDYRALVRYHEMGEQLATFSRELEASAAALATRAANTVVAEPLQLMNKYREAAVTMMREFLKDITQNIGFEQLRASVKLTLDRYYAFLQPQFQSNEIPNSLEDFYTSFQSYWSLLSSETFCSALRRFKFGLDRDLEKITKAHAVDCSDIKQEIDKFPEVQAALLGRKFHYKGQSLPDLIEVYLVNLREESLCQFEQAKQSFVKHARIWAAKEDEITQQSEEIWSGITDCLLVTNPSYDPNDKFEYYAGLSKAMLRDVENIQLADDINEFTLSFITSQQTNFNLSIAEFTLQSRELMSMNYNIRDYRQKLENIIVQLRQNIHQRDPERLSEIFQLSKSSAESDPYSAACQALTEVALKEPIRYPSVRQEVEFIMQETRKQLLDEISVFGPGFADELDEFRQVLLTSLQSMAKPELRGFPDVEEHYEALKLRYSPLEEELGQYSGQFLTQRLEKINVVYSKWFSAFQKRIPAGRALAEVHNSLLLQINQKTMISPELRAKFFMNFERSFKSINNKYNAPHNPGLERCLLVLKSYLWISLERMITARVAYLQQKQQRDSHSVRALVEIQSRRNEPEATSMFEDFKKTFGLD